MQAPDSTSSSDWASFHGYKISPLETYHVPEDENWKHQQSSSYLSPPLGCAREILAQILTYLFEGHVKIES